MSQRILERGQIETLASRGIPRVRLPQSAQPFARRAERLRRLAEGHAIGGYLCLMAAVADAQQALLDAGVDAAPPAPEALAHAAAHRMPPLAAASTPAAPPALLRRLVGAMGAAPGRPPALDALLARLHAAPDDWIEAQAAAVLGARAAAVDAAAAPFVMAAQQVRWIAAARAFAAERVAPLDVPGVCPLCGSLPVASIVHAQAPYEGYRYLHCGLCATEWHCVRAQCSHCGSARRVGYYTPSGATAADADAAAVRAEACDDCRGYRKIVYVEKDAGVEPLADDLASLALDLLLAEQGYHRVGGHPLLWQADEG